MASDGHSGRTCGAGTGQVWTRWASLLAVGSLAVGVVVTGVQAARGPEAPAAPGHGASVGRVSFSDAVRVDRRTGITATLPRTVAVTTSIPVSGVVVLASGLSASRRPVRLEERRGGVWRVIDARRSNRRGGFQFDVAAGATTGARTLRVVAPAYRTLARQRTLARAVDVAEQAPAPTTAPTTTPTATATGTPDWDPAEYPAATDPSPVGSARDWSWLMSKTARWDPCTTIRWVYNGNGAYAGSLDDMKRSIARVAGRTGLHFAYVGTSSYVPYSETGTFPKGADIAVGWSDARHVSRLAGSVVGVGGGTMYDVTGQDVAGRMVQGSVLLDRDASLAHGFTRSGSPTWVQVMEHEVMHAIGLNHATGAEEVMAPAVSSLNHFFGAGDLTGMARVGATHGCLS